MQNDFQILSQFLGHFETEVEGHSATVITPELESKLHAFARGELAAPERDQMVALALEDDGALEMLAAAAREVTENSL